MHGFFDAKIGGKSVVVQYEPDAELRDMENVPLLEDGGVRAFIEREVLPHSADAWVDKDATKIGYEISFNRYFYKLRPLRSLDEIAKDVAVVERETEGLLKDIVGGSL
jgi:type I restriction enzyme M protein